MSIPNKVIDIPINNGDNHICPDDNIRIIYQKIIGTIIQHMINMLI